MRELATYHDGSEKGGGKMIAVAIDEDVDILTDVREVVKETNYLIKEINGSIEYFRYDSILQGLGRFRLKICHDGFMMADTGPNIVYEYTTHNCAVLKAVAYNLHVVDTTSTMEKARILVAVKNLLIDLS